MAKQKRKTAPRRRPRTPPPRQEASGWSLPLQTVVGMKREVARLMRREKSLADRMKSAEVNGRDRIRLLADELAADRAQRIALEVRLLGHRETMNGKGAEPCPD